MNVLIEQILYLGQREKGSIDNLVLNKVLCLSFRDYLHEHGNNELIQSLDDQGFELSAYGLIHARSYREYKYLGRFPIQQQGVYHEELSDFDTFIKKWLNVSLGEMVEEAQNYDLWGMNIEQIKKGETIQVSLKSI